MVDSPVLRTFLLKHFDDADIKVLCFDYFPEVYEQFAEGMSKGQRIQYLLDYCRKQGLEAELLVALKRKRPQLYEQILVQQTVITKPVSKAHSAATSRSWWVSIPAWGWGVSVLIFLLLFVAVINGLRTLNESPAMEETVAAVAAATMTIAPRETPMPATTTAIVNKAHEQELTSTVATAVETVPLSRDTATSTPTFTFTPTKIPTAIIVQPTHTPTKTPVVIMQSTPTFVAVGGEEVIYLEGGLLLTFEGTVSENESFFYTLVNDSDVQTIISLTMSSNGNISECAVIFTGGTLKIPEDSRQQFLQSATSSVNRLAIVPSGNHILSARHIDYGKSECPTILSFTLTISIAA